MPWKLEPGERRHGVMHIHTWDHPAASTPGKSDAAVSGWHGASGALVSARFGSGRISVDRRCGA